MKAQCVIDRLEQIVQFLDRNIRQAIHLAAYFERAAYDRADIKIYFDQSRAAPGYNQVLDAIYFELVVTMARLYDDPHADDKSSKTASIPVAMSILEDPTTLPELRSRLLTRHDPSEIRGADQSTILQLKQSTESDIDGRLKTIAPILDAYMRLKGNCLLQRIKTARNEFMAHTTLNPTMNNKLAYGNAEQLLAKTIPIVAALQSLVLSYHISYEHDRNESAEEAEIFWTKVISK